MKRKEFPSSGGENFEIEDLEWIQTAANQAINGLATILGTGSYIISGVEDNGTSISDGWIYHDGEVIRFVGGDTHATVSIIDEEINTGENDWEKYATPGVGGDQEIAYTSLQKLPALSDTPRVEDNVSNTQVDYELSLGANGGWKTFALDGYDDKQLLLAKIVVDIQEGAIGLKFRKPGDSVNDTIYSNYGEGYGDGTHEFIYIPVSGGVIEAATVGTSGGILFDLTIIASF